MSPKAPEVNGQAPSYLPVLPTAAGRALRIGCIGTGFIMADCHLVAYRHAGFNPWAIAGRNREHTEAVAKRHQIPRTYADYRELIRDPQIEVVDIAVPPDIQLDVVREVVSTGKHIRGVLAQKPLGRNLAEAVTIVRLCDEAGIKLVVNQNMRYDQSVRSLQHLLAQGSLGTPVLATIDMRAIPHWMPWQERQGWVTLRIMSIHHLDTFRFWFGDPVRVYASVRPDPRTNFPHEDGICLVIMEYANGLRAMTCDDVWAGPAKEGAASDIGIRWRVEGTTGLARGTIGWPDYPTRSPSTLDYSTTKDQGAWHQPRWSEVWFPDAFVGPMAELLRWVDEDVPANLNGRDNLRTMALVEACYESAREHRAIEPLVLLDAAEKL